MRSGGMHKPWCPLDGRKEIQKTQPLLPSNGCSDFCTLNLVVSFSQTYQEIGCQLKLSPFHWQSSCFITKFQPFKGERKISFSVSLYTQYNPLLIHIFWQRRHLALKHCKKERE